MPVFVVGANFRSAPLELLERLAIDVERRPKALAGLLDLEHVHEAVVVSTCNRVEVYTAISRFHGAAGDVRRFLADLHGLGLEEFASHLYDYYEERAVQHLFAVAAGVDSMVVGEAQILSQVREAFQAAQAERTAGPVLSAVLAAGAAYLVLGEPRDALVLLGFAPVALDAGGSARVTVCGSVRPLRDSSRPRTRP